MSVAQYLILAYYGLNIILAWYYAGTRKVITYTPGAAVFTTLFSLGIAAWVLAQ